MQSMTGFGHIEKQYEVFDLVVEMKTVNSRYFDFKARLGREVNALEPKIKSEVQKKISRGRVDLYLELRQKTQDLYELNQTLAANYISLSKDLRHLDVPGTLNVSDMFGIPGIIIQKQQKGFSETEVELILAAIGETVDLVYKSRRAEGENIRSDLEKHLDKLNTLVNQISNYAEDVEQHYRERLLTRIDEHLDREVVDEQRLAQEILYHVDRSDISEEISRLKSHTGRFKTYMEESESSQVGKKLDFLCQEMVRESNTIMSKSGVIQITEIGVECKAVIERLREQVQNVE